MKVGNKFQMNRGECKIEKLNQHPYKCAGDYRPYVYMVSTGVIEWSDYVLQSTVKRMLPGNIGDKLASPLRDTTENDCCVDCGGDDLTRIPATETEPGEWTCNECNPNVESMFDDRRYDEHKDRKAEQS